MRMVLSDSAECLSAYSLLSPAGTRGSTHSALLTSMLPLLPFALNLLELNRREACPFRDLLEPVRHLRRRGAGLQAMGKWRGKVSKAVFGARRHLHPAPALE